MIMMQEPLDGIAVVGLAGRFPGAASVAALWPELLDGREGLAALDDDALAAAGVPAALRQDPDYVRVSGALRDAALLDAGFFGFTPAEAALTAPEQRLFLECAWEALESAGHAVPGKRVGVFGGTGLNGYFITNVIPSLGGAAGDDFFQAALANAPDHLATRVAYRLDLRGPCLTVQTACSTSLVAVHLACQSLLSGECDVALAGGATVATSVQGYLYQEGGILSPDGHCRPFDARAAGTVPGSGVALVALRRLEDALADGDPIEAVIRGSAINNDGAAKVGYTAPSVEGQAAVIAEALAVAGVEPETVGYVETHGTGTSMGDPIEVAALARVYGASGARPESCVLGSVKGNLGHLDAAAGAAGLIKAVLALKHGRIPGTLHFETPNPAIDFAGTPFTVSARTRDWPAHAGRRRAAVSSFGMGGTNAHVVLEEAPARADAPSGRSWHLLPLSAKTPSALEAASTSLEHFLSAEEPPLADAAWTLQSRRQAFTHRRVVLADGPAAAADALHARDPERTRSGRAPEERRGVVFLFPGQGSQHPEMAAELYRTEPTFREAVDRCGALLQPRLGFDLRTVLYPPEGGMEAAAARLRDTAVAQPALFTVEYALATLWMEWGIRPQAMLGHSVGEYVAATLAGVFRLEDALALVAERGRLMGSLAPGAMLSVALAADEVSALLDAELSLAADNGSTQCVVSGPDDAVAELAAELDARGVKTRRLHTSHAFHSAMMDPALDAFAAAVAAVPRGEPHIPFVSNRTGRWILPEEAADPGYWADHLRHTVRFREGLQHFAGRPEVVMLEVGPGQTLSALVDGLADESESGEATPVFASLRHPREADSDALVLHRALGGLWLAGVEVDWAGYWTHERRRAVALPTYPFERARHWIDAPARHARTEEAPAASAELPALPASVGALAGGSTLEWLIAEQLKLMTRQIHLVRGSGAPALTVPAAAESAAPESAGPEVPLTPVQRWLFAQGRNHPEHFNHAALFELAEPVEVPRLRRAAALVAEHHDALRLRAAQDGPRGWLGHAAESVSVTVENLSAVAPADRAAAVERVAAAAHAGIDLVRGPLMRMVVMDFGRGLGSARPGCLLVVLHHLAVDVLSWGVLLADLQQAYAELGRGLPVRLPPRTAAFSDWARRLADYARSGAAAGEAAFWTSPVRALARPLPRRHADARNAEGAVRTLETALDVEATRALLERAPRAYEAQVNDVLLAALSPVLAAWAGGPVAVDMEGHGREDLFPGIDLSRTVGWFTAIHPMVLDGVDDEVPAAAAARVRDLLREVPDGGIGYGLLRYASDDAELAGRLAALPRAEVIFHYAGVVGGGGAAGGADGLFTRPLAGLAGPLRHPDDERVHLLEIDCSVAGGRLHATWRWGGDVLDGTAVEGAAAAFIDRLAQIALAAEDTALSVSAAAGAVNAWHTATAG
jgi:phthiocerol/phenolphthiocerol synthesis type-I polyketide synthase E